MCFGILESAARMHDCGSMGIRKKGLGYSRCSDSLFRANQPYLFSYPVFIYLHMKSTTCMHDCSSMGIQMEGLGVVFHCSELINPTLFISLSCIYLQTFEQFEMSWIVVIPKEGRAAPALLLVWHQPFRFFLKFFFGKVGAIRDIFAWRAPINRYPSIYFQTFE